MYLAPQTRPTEVFTNHGSIVMRGAKNAGLGRAEADTILAASARLASALKLAFELRPGRPVSGVNIQLPLNAREGRNGAYAKSRDVGRGERALHSKARRQEVAFGRASGVMGLRSQMVHPRVDRLNPVNEITTEQEACSLFLLGR
jgi:hypothetical protein